MSPKTPIADIGFWQRADSFSLGRNDTECHRPGRRSRYRCFRTTALSGCSTGWNICSALWNFPERPPFPVSLPPFPVSLPSFPVPLPSFPVSLPSFPVPLPSFPVPLPSFSFGFRPFSFGFRPILHTLPTLNGFAYTKLRAVSQRISFKCRQCRHF